MKKNDLVLYLALGFIAYLLVNSLKNGVKNMFGNIGLGNTQDDDKRESTIKNVASDVKAYFNPNFYDKKGAKLLTVAVTQDICKKIYDSVGYVWDNPDETIGQFKRAKFKTQISWIAYHFQLKYSKDLYSYLNDKMDTDKQRLVWLDILKYVDSLPKGY